MAADKIAARMRPDAAMVHEVIRQEGEEELARSPSALAFSGVAPGLPIASAWSLRGCSGMACRTRHGAP